MSENDKMVHFPHKDPKIEDLWQDANDFLKFETIERDDSDLDETPEIYVGGRRGTWRDPEWKRKSDNTNRLLLLLKMAEVADSQSCAVSFEEISELLYDMGLRLSNGEFLSQRNEDVFEDPLNRGDPLGNVRMIHKRFSIPDQGLAESFGKFLVFVVRELVLLRKTKTASWDNWDAILPLIEAYDDTASEEILAAKERIVMLRRDLERLDRRNEALFVRLQKAIDGRERLKAHYALKILNLLEVIDQLKTYIESLHLNDLVKQQSTLNSCSGESELLQNRSRKPTEARNQHSQLDFIDW